VLKFTLNSGCPAGMKGYILIRWDGFPVWNAPDPTKHSDYIIECDEVGARVVRPGFFSLKSQSATHKEGSHTERISLTAGLDQPSRGHVLDCLLCAQRNLVVST
jgi:hypothetical protein